MSKGQNKDGELSLAKQAQQNAVATVEDGQWDRDLTRQAETTAAMAMEMIQESMDDIDPNHLIRVATESFNMARTLKQQPTRLDMTVGIKVDGSDLGHADLVRVISGNSSDMLSNSGDTVNISTHPDTKIRNADNSPTHSSCVDRKAEAVEAEELTKKGETDQYVEGDNSEDSEE